MKWRKTYKNLYKVLQEMKNTEEYLFLFKKVSVKNTSNTSLLPTKASKLLRPPRPSAQDLFAWPVGKKERRTTSVQSVTLLLGTFWCHLVHLRVIIWHFKNSTSRGPNSGEFSLAFHRFMKFAPSAHRSCSSRWLGTNSRWRSFQRGQPRLSQWLIAGLGWWFGILEYP